MPLTTVILTDSLVIRRTYYLLDEHSLSSASEVWNDTDRLLQSVQNNPFYAGRTRWRDLDPVHFQTMILLTLGHLAAVPDEELEDLDNPVVRSLVFLLSALVYCLQSRTGSIIETLRINRFAPSDASFDFSASLCFDFGSTAPGHDLFEVIVDNE